MARRTCALQRHNLTLDQTMTLPKLGGLPRPSADPRAAMSMCVGRSALLCTLHCHCHCCPCPPAQPRPPAIPVVPDAPASQLAREPSQAVEPCFACAGHGNKPKVSKYNGCFDAARVGHGGHGGVDI
ncbi:hypothetical protein ACJQWK_03976 [Exserohilum turcicum]